MGPAQRAAAGLVAAAHRHGGGGDVAGGERADGCQHEPGAQPGPGAGDGPLGPALGESLARDTHALHRSSAAHTRATLRLPLFLTHIKWQRVYIQLHPLHIGY